MTASIQDLIVGNSADYHAVAVCWAIKKLGGNPLIWDGLSPDNGLMSISIGINSCNFSLQGNKIKALRSLWFRRQVPYKEITNLVPEARKFVERELLDAHKALCVSAERLSGLTICGSATKVSSNKSLQLQIAAEVGFRIPETLISNDYESVASFSREQSTIVKHFAPHYFIHPLSGCVRAIGPSEISGFDEIDRASIEVAPAIYQKKIDKDYEIRLTVIGSRLFPAKISAKNGPAFLDWRPELGKEECKIEACKLNHGLEQRSLRLMRRLGLVYGCIDLAVGKDGNVYFLEINPGGQFLFVEDMVRELPLLRAFASMMTQSSIDYNLDITNTKSISINEFEKSDDFIEWEKIYASEGNNERFVTFVQ